MGENRGRKAWDAKEDSKEEWFAMGRAKGEMA